MTIEPTILYGATQDSRISVQRSLGTRVVSLMLVTLLHGLVLYALFVGHRDAFARLGTSRAAASGLLVEISIYTGSKRQLTMSSPQATVLHRSLETAMRTRASDTAKRTHGSSTKTTTAANHETANTSALTEEIDNGIASDFQNRLVAHIETYRQYPADAVRDHAEGVVELIFTMDRNGIVLGVWVKQSSGYPALDKEAIATVLRAQPLPPVPPELPAPLNVTLPVAFSAHE